MIRRRGASTRASRRVLRDLSVIATDRKIVDRDYRLRRIEALCAEDSIGRRKLCVEIAMGSG